MSQIVLARRGESGLDQQVVRGMFRLRHEVFRDRLRWDVPSRDGLEYDEFDRYDPVYTVVTNEQREIVGCWRLLPTTGPYMLRDVFPQLLHGHEAPCDPDVWEISRFAVTSRGGDDRRYGFGGISVRMMQGLVTFAWENGISRYVAVTSTGVERMLRRLGLSVTRYGPPQRIGEVDAVACAIEFYRQTRAALDMENPEIDRRIAA